MARDTGGTYSLPAGFPLGYNLRPVPSSLLNSGYSDLATEITDSLSRTGKGGMLANLAMGGFSITGANNGTFAGALSAATLSGAGSAITALNASQLTSGTIPDARFPATLPAASGANLTNLNGSAIATGTVALARLPTIPTTQITGLAAVATSASASDLSTGTLAAARFPATLPAADGSALTNLNGSAVASGTVAVARLGSGVPSASNFLRGDGTWQTISGTIPGGGTTGQFLRGDSTWSSTIVGTLTATTFSGAHSGDGSALTALNATQLTSGTVPDARFPATLPAVSGANLTALNAAQVTTGTLPVARLNGGTTGQFVRGDGAYSNSLIGDFGVGVSPAVRLDVQSASGVEGTIRLTSPIDGSNATPRASSFSFRSGTTPIETARIASFNRIANFAGGDLVFSTADSSNVLQQRAVIDSSGNLGLGVTPKTWGINLKAIQVGDYAAFAHNVANAAAIVASNAYNNDNTNWRYLFTGVAAARYEAAVGAHAWFTAPSGTAGNAISFSQAMTLDASGNLGIGTASPGYRLDVVDAGGNLFRFTRSTDQLGAFISSGTCFFGGISNSPLAFVTNNIDRMRIASAGNVTINAPASGNTLALAQTTGNFALAITGTSPEIRVTDGGAQTAIISIKATNTANILDFSWGTGGVPASIRVGNTEAIGISTGRNVTIPAPTSGDHTVAHSAGGSQAIGYLGIPRSTTATTLVVADRGKCVAVTAGITVPNSTFAAGDAVSIYNDSAAAITITAGVTTLRQAGTTNTGNRTLAARGMATVWFNSATEAVISGSGLS